MSELSSNTVALFWANVSWLPATITLTPSRIVSEFSNVTGEEAKAVQISSEVFKSFNSPTVAQEMLENMLLLEEPGYFPGEDLAWSKAL